MDITSTNNLKEFWVLGNSWPVPDVNSPKPTAAAQTFPFATQNVRYVRVVGSKLGQDDFGTYRMQFAEIEVAGGNLAAGRQVSSVAAGSPQYARVDLGGPSLISRVDLYARSDGGNTGNGFPIDFTIETSLDGASWTPVATVNDLPQPGSEVQAHTFPATTARYELEIR